jgi:hypothetical protein
MLKPRPVHDLAASTVNLAKSWLMALEGDPRNETTLPTATLKMFLQAIVEKGETQQIRDMRQAGLRGVMESFTRLDEASREERDQAARRTDEVY